MAITKKRFVLLIIFSIFLGIILQRIFNSFFKGETDIYNYIGFAIIIPVLVSMTIGLLHIFKIKSKTLILISGVILFFIILNLNLIFSTLTRYGTFPSSSLYEIINLVASIPFTILGLIYGAYIFKNINNNSDLSKKGFYAIIGGLIALALGILIIPWISSSETELIINYFQNLDIDFADYSFDMEIPFIDITFDEQIDRNLLREINKEKLYSDIFGKIIPIFILFLIGMIMGWLIREIQEKISFKKDKKRKLKHKPEKEKIYPNKV